jgi:hypothetical protein
MVDSFYIAKKIMIEGRIRGGCQKNAVNGREIFPVSFR